MSKRKYSLDEIDRMREAVRDLMTSWRYYGHGASGAVPDAGAVEERLRTHMQNGTDPADLEDKSAKRREKGYAHGLWLAALDEEREKQAPPRPEPTVVPGFHSETAAHPFRCIKCNRMQRADDTLVWVNASAHFHGKDGYDRLAHASSKSSERSAWCVPCVLATKRIRDAFLPKVAAASAPRQPIIFFDPSTWTGRAER